MTKIRMGVYMPIKKNVFVGSREIEIDKKWEDITVEDVKQYLLKDERLEGYCLVYENEEKQWM
ncbi:MAG: hypothetical protein IIW58_08825 [Bacteroidales bacterium]|nr:hypothetical protein [Bacteroidales bacterium]